MIPTPPGLFFRHVGPRERLYDFHWNTDDPCTIVSVSYDPKIINGGRTLQVLEPNHRLLRQRLGGSTPCSRAADPSLVMNKFYEIRERETDSYGDKTWQEKCSLLLDDPLDKWVFSSDSTTSTSKYIEQQLWYETKQFLR